MDVILRMSYREAKYTKLIKNRNLHSSFPCLPTLYVLLHTSKFCCTSDQQVFCRSILVSRSQRVPGFTMLHCLRYCYARYSSVLFYISASNDAFCNCSHRFLFAIAPSSSGFRSGLTFAHIYILNEIIILTIILNFEIIMVICYD
jgi:hypothetical protein